MKSSLVLVAFSLLLAATGQFKIGSIVSGRVWSYAARANRILCRETESSAPKTLPNCATLLDKVWSCLANCRVSRAEARQKFP
jgi:hypothetical protein